MLTNVLTLKYTTLYNIYKDVMFIMKKKNIKNDISIVKKYLRDSFYVDPYTIYTIKKINKDTNVNKDTIKLVIDMLRRKKLINNKYEFKLTLEAANYLDGEINNFKSHLYSIIAIFLSIYSLSYSISAIFITNNLFFFFLFNILFLFAIVFYCSYICIRNEILNFI